MNTMVVSLMKSVQGNTIQLFASEKALVAYCSFHHMLLYFANKFPILQQHAETVLSEFIRSDQNRHKAVVPNLGEMLLLLLLTNKHKWIDIAVYLHFSKT